MNTYRIATCNGLGFNLSQPAEEVLRRTDRQLIEEIAHGLACTYRWHGQLRAPITVAQHSLNCSLLARPEADGAAGMCPDLAVECLLHDAAEAWYGDRARPMKALEEDGRRFGDHIERTVYDYYHDECLMAVFDRFGLSMRRMAEVHLVDDECLAGEFARWGEGDPNDFGLKPPTRPLPCAVPLGWQTAKALFLARWDALEAARVTVISLPGESDNG